MLDHAPAARLNVTVSLATLLGCREAQVAELLRHGAAVGDETALAVAPGSADGVGEVPGLGFLSGEVCRTLLLTPGTVVNRLVTDPTTGVAFDAAAMYRVPAGMARVVRARDHTCRAPACEHATWIMT